MCSSPANSCNRSGSIPGGDIKDRPTLYDADIERYGRASDDAASICERLIDYDIRCAADCLRPTYDASAASDGYVSLEVSPHFAGDTSATLSDAERLWSLVQRLNLMINIPATRAGLAAIEVLIAAGINVNVTMREMVVPRPATSQNEAPSEQSRPSSAAMSKVKGARQ